MKTTTTSSIQRRRRRGSTYISVVITMSVVGLMLAAYLKLIDVQNQLTMRSQTWNRTVPVTEAGIEEAIAHLNLNGSPQPGGIIDLTKLSTDGWSGNAIVGWTKTGQLDNENQYAVRIEPWSGSTNEYPRITATGYVASLPAFALKRSSFGPFLAASLIDLETAVSNRLALRRVVECTTTNNPTFIRGLVAKRDIDLNGNNIYTDSYDSTDPAASGPNGQYDPDRARDHGDIASNGTIVNIGNATIRGSVATGPFGQVNIRNGVVGDDAFCDDPANTGQIQTNHFTDDMSVQFEDAVLPRSCGGSVISNCVSWVDLTAYAIPGKTNIGGVDYLYVLDSGNYSIEGVPLKDSVYIQGAVRIWVKSSSSINITGSDQIRIAGRTNSLTLYAGCATASIGGQGLVNDTEVPANFMYFGLNNNTSLSISGGSRFIGCIYAPYASLALNGSGDPKDPTDFCGAAIVASASLNGHFAFHYDEALPKIGIWRGFKVTSWNEK
jgi:hypothetical protein